MWIHALAFCLTISISTGRESWDVIGANKGARRGWEAFELVTKEVSGRDKLKEEIES